MENVVLWIWGDVLQLYVMSNYKKKSTYYNYECFEFIEPKVLTTSYERVDNKHIITFKFTWLLEF